MKQSSIPSARAVVSAFRAQGIKHIVISPGSRNAPLTINFTNNHFFKCYSIVDERCAAFFAMGIALQKKEPVAIVCTSGSALLNYYPAVAEAFYSRVPLVVVSADRPPYKIDVGDGQTIRQDNVFERHIGYSANLKLDATHAMERLKKYAPQLNSDSQQAIDEYNQRELEKVLSCAFNQELPVHINIPFEEPLYNTKEFETEDKFSIATPILNSNVLMDIDVFQKLWNGSKKKMVLVGVNHPNEIDEYLLDILANDPSVIVFTETTSNLHHPNFFPSIDSIIFPIEKSAKRDSLFKDLQPEILLTFGGLIVSKKIKAFLREYKPKHHWHVDKIKAYDTYFSLTRHFKTNPNNFFKTFLSTTEFNQSVYFKQWKKVKLAYEKSREKYIGQVSFSDFRAFEFLAQTIPENYQVHLANSSTVRYAQLFDMKPSIKVFCNRGTSGIDGSTATAIGASIYEKHPTLLITGDLSFFYDSNALWNNYIRNDFRIVIINNSGGGIFRILPGNDESENYKTFFETSHNLNAYYLSQQYGFDYHKADDDESLKKVWQTFYNKSKKPKLLEIFTPRTVNNKILLGYFDFIS
ncbi:2-succinyl-5-enolpyruvyl-6-hydroxy-3-cyclohexene-1-carboxylic-acid synthase [Croceitalea rosinachiae]|uniref:2-succinyl-5-enolpyruvyl-6-hydroxy-3-cyclohexene-1-carboxylate synthase n=1 Tax=Croceitalea rosinachiae TaxID=3075596 RepID=A0ABU3AAZ9_9FLAO|nr:2-succinyl-5-enolpyruvyl-6-hydroxy-3-cyclohexene-1-carboxylic-acid synthase [Croceitalea sp. F388]MDT0607359.1 2-succinyl-5-enolpyruvyl-6-hydroxy-3-cyclohexene-1-carboxylic-acid synthase [Croceitalea sp. F388]